ncbi:hypothetical protein VTK56DRAFT_1787 [Thermocarpiscus australiensis]
MGRYPAVAWINHDCRPHISYRISNLSHTPVAARDISPGEELSSAASHFWLHATSGRRGYANGASTAPCAHCSPASTRAAFFTMHCLVRRRKRKSTVTGCLPAEAVEREIGSHAADLWKA